MREAPASGRRRGRSWPGGWLFPVLFLAVTLVLLALSWQGFFFNRVTAPWIAGGVLAILGLWWGFLTTTILIDAGTLVEYGIGIRGTQRVLAEAEQRLEARRAGRA